MIINIENFDETKLKRIVIEFSDSDNTEIVTPKKNTENVTIKPNRKSTKEEKISSRDSEVLSFDDLDTTNVSQEEVKKPEIPEIERKPMVSDNMQNLEI